MQGVTCSQRTIALVRGRTEQALRALLARTHSYRQLSAVCCVEDVHEHTGHPPTKFGSRKLTERRMVGIFVIGGNTVATAASTMLPSHSQVEQPTYPWLLPATSATNTQLPEPL